MEFRCRLDVDGSLRLPADLLRERRMEEGDEVLFEIENGALRLRCRQAALRRIQARMELSVPRGVSLADELIAERRREAERE